MAQVHAHEQNSVALEARIEVAYREPPTISITSPVEGATIPQGQVMTATYGCSSSAENQLKLASLGHPAHKAMIAYSAGVGVAEAGPFREQGNFWRGGVWQQGWANYFFSEMPIACELR